MRTKIIAMITAVFLVGCKSKASGDLVPLAYPETFAEVVEQFKGQVVYVDLFGSWCKPCIEQLGYAAQSDEFFTDNNIARLYISVDYKIEGIHKSFGLLNRHDIKGYFLSIYNPADMQDKSSDFFRQMDEFTNIANRAIPQYIIIDKNGNVVESTAKKPSDLEALKEQLSKYL